MTSGDDKEQTGAEKVRAATERLREEVKHGKRPWTAKVTRAIRGQQEEGEER